MIPVTQATTFSGRLHCAAEVIDALLALDYPNLHRLWLTNGPHPLTEYGLLRRGLPKAVHIGAPVTPQITKGHEARLEKKKAICAAWADLIERAIALDNDLLVIEDDIVAPPHAVRVLQGIAHGWPAGAASGITRTNTGEWPFYEFVGSQLTLFNRKPPAPMRFLGTGTFCLYLRQDVLRKMAETHYKPEWDLLRYGMVGKDCHLGVWLRENGYELVVTPDVECRHLVEVDRGVTVRR